MSNKITIEDVAKEAGEHEWKLLSTSYKNLQTPLKFECNEGHSLELPFKAVRNKWICPVCAANKYDEAGHSMEVVEKKKDVYRTLALDQATHTSGWSVFDGDELIKYGIFSTRGSNEIERLAEMREWLIQMITVWNVDLVAIEGIQYQQYAGVTTFQTLARLQGALMITIYESKKEMEICPTNTWRSYNKVKGRSRSDKKQSAKKIVKDTYDVTVTEDEADSILIGRYASHKCARHTAKHVKMVRF